jgi:hypothetical protein
MAVVAIAKRPTALPAPLALAEARVTQVEVEAPPFTSGSATVGSRGGARSD